jgi:hypothetical protein
MRFDPMSLVSQENSWQRLECNEFNTPARSAVKNTTARANASNASNVAVDARGEFAMCHSKESKQKSRVSKITLVPTAVNMQGS